MEYVTPNPSHVLEYANAELLRQLDEQHFVRWAHGYLIAHFPTLQPEERQDVIQDSYLRLLWRSEDYWRLIRQPFRVNATYLRAAVHTAALDFIRRAQRTRALFVEVDPWNLVELYLPAAEAAAFGHLQEPSAEKTVQLEEFLCLAQERIDRMPPERRKIMKLFLAGHSYFEIANMLSRSPNTIRNHLRTARQDLRNSLPEIAMYVASL